MPADEDELFSGTIVAFLEIKLQRNGMMSIGGTITDEAAILGMIDTARATLVNNFRAAREGKIIVPGYDTALVGTDYEKRLISATDELHRARDRV